jgi:hypothetical protein
MTLNDVLLILGSKRWWNSDTIRGLRDDCYSAAAPVAYAQCETEGSEGRPLRVSRSQLSNEVVCELLNSLGIPEGVEGSYLLVNTLHPFFPIRYISEADRFVVTDEAMVGRSAIGVSWIGATVLAACLGGRLPYEVEWEAAYASHMADFEPEACTADEWCLDWFHRDRDGGVARPARIELTEEKVLRRLPRAELESPAGALTRRGKWWRVGSSTTGLRPVWDRDPATDPRSAQAIVFSMLSTHGPRAGFQVPGCTAGEIVT